MSRTTDFRSLVIKADPNHVVSSRRVAEYEFSAPARASALPPHPDSDPLQDYSRRSRTFYANYQTSGAYALQDDQDNGLLWNGVPLTWNGIPLTWGDG